MLTDGTKLKITITLDAELVTETEGVTYNQIYDMFYKDSAYGLKSIVVGKLGDSCDDGHDTEIIWDNMEIKISERK